MEIYRWHENCIQLQTIFTNIIIIFFKICSKNISYISTFFFSWQKNHKIREPVTNTLQTRYSIVLLEQLLKRSGMQLVFIHQR